MCWGTISLQHTLFIPSTSTFQSSSPSHSVTLFFSSPFSGCRCLILCIKNCLRPLSVEYFMPFNFPWAFKATFTFLPPFLLISPSFFLTTQQISVVTVVTFQYKLCVLYTVIIKWTDPNSLHWIMLASNITFPPMHSPHPSKWTTSVAKLETSALTEMTVTYFIMVSRLYTELIK